MRLFCFAKPHIAELGSSNDYADVLVGRLIVASGGSIWSRAINRGAAITHSIQRPRTMANVRSFTPILRMQMVSGISAAEFTAK